MSKKDLYKMTRTTIYMPVPIYTDEYLRKFILDNSFMRNRINNDFTEEADKYKGDYNMYYDFKPRQFKTKYYNDIELPENRYNYYCVGLSEQVADDFDKNLKTVRTKNKKRFEHKSNNKLGKFHFKRFDYNRYSFKVKLKPTLSTNNKIWSRLRIIDEYNIKFMVRGKYAGKDEEIISIKLKEPLYDTIINNDNPLYTKYYSSNNYINGCSFLLSDIKEISFMYECGKYYVILCMHVDYSIHKKSIHKDSVCGIDTGIRHPVTLYDGNKTMYLRMDDKTTRKIHYLERRIRRLQHYLDKKYEINKNRTGVIYSNNTIKLIKKIRRLYRKITNIKKFWIQNRCKEIATTYSKICVDNYEFPNANDNKSLPKIVQRKINYASKFHKMSYFNEFLKHSCIKYGCEYIESPEDTTRTCSICGHINDHLPLNKTHLICAKCKTPIERDMNAARNCYYYLLDNA